MSVARRNLKEADAPNSDSTNRNRIQGRRGGVTRQWTGMPDSHPDTHAGKSGEARAKDYTTYPGRSLVSVRTIRTTAPATARDGAGEVSRGRSSSLVLVYARGGPTMPRKSERRAESILARSSLERLDGRGATARQALTNGSSSGNWTEESAPRLNWRRRHRIWRARGVTSVHGVGPSTSLDRTTDGGGDPALRT